MKTLANLKPGQSGVVRELTAEGAVKQRFLDMGITRGVTVTLERRAPFGRPARSPSARLQPVPSQGRGKENLS